VELGRMSSFFRVIFEEWIEGFVLGPLSMDSADYAVDQNVLLHSFKGRESGQGDDEILSIILPQGKICGLADFG
jgi:hypothetical protein